MRSMLRSIPVFAGDLQPFPVSQAPDRPEDLFVQWLSDALAAGVAEPHAMTLATVGSDGLPDARVLILKDLDEHGWRFASHAHSPKGQDLARHPAAALTFYWPQQARQVRVRGRVAPEPAERSAADFLARPLGSRAEASIGRQSQPLKDPAELEQCTTQAVAALEAEPHLVVPEWTLYTLTPAQVEFWQGDRQRRHTRLRYTATTDGGWMREALWP
ncbi:pyridoxal 5'-phosphate synthase [Actinoplanes sp. NPDC049548]|uniref:pyridoxine/pyridoxamine 5'-phosphate oxidase n=1 Tax=Actinoplanes sp. NPDC049548 TaxID=3155152 RepID=UPI00344A6EF7